MFEHYKGGDTNFAPLILANGSIVAMCAARLLLLLLVLLLLLLLLLRLRLCGSGSAAPAHLPVGCCSPARVCARRWRHWGGGNGGSRQFLATASDWRDPSSYIQHNTELFPDLGAAGTEDQFVYQAGAATAGL